MLLIHRHSCTIVACACIVRARHIISNNFIFHKYDLSAERDTAREGGSTGAGLPGAATARLSDTVIMDMIEIIIDIIDMIESSMSIILLP